MVKKHISRDYSMHEKEIIRPNDDYCMFEVFAHDPSYTKLYTPSKNSFKSTNATKTNWRAWNCYKATDGNKSMQFSFNHNFKDSGEYHIEFLYEQNNYIYKDKKLNSSKDIVGSVSIGGNETKILFDGENNIIKRIQVFEKVEKGNRKVTVTVPPNCYFYGCIIRKIRYYFGDNLDSADSELMLLSATFTNSSMTKPNELSVSIGYDDAFENWNNPSGFYMDYMDECNLYVKDITGKKQRIFGGYISSILPDSDRTKLTISCADRLRDGVNKYVLDQLVLQGGTKPITENEYSEGMELDFESYAHVLKYLCDVHETTLKSNISKNYLVEGEKSKKGLVFTFGTKKKIKKITTQNCTSAPQNNFITIRNDSKSDKPQYFTLWEAKNHAKAPLDCSNYGFFSVTYGLGDPKTESKTTGSTGDENSAGGQKFSKCGVSADGKYVMAIGTVSSARDSGSYGTYYKTVFKNKCPHCGSAKLVWDSCRSGTNCVHTMGWGGSKRTWGVPANETEITCNNCDSDYSAMGNEKDSPWKKLQKVSSTVKSSKAEQDKLYNGNMVAVPTSGASYSPDDLFKDITKIAFKYRYNVGGGSSSYSAMKKSGYGDCWAFSDLIFTELKKKKVSCKIVEYGTAYSSSHRSVMYKKDNGQWADFPYREYGWNTRYNNMLNNTSNSKYGSAVETYNGSTIGQATGGSSSSSESTTVTTIDGYDKDKPFQAYFEITYSTVQSFDAPTKKLYVDFTQKSGKPVGISGIKTYWINKSTRQSSLPINIVDFLDETTRSGRNIYLHSIKFCTPKKEQKEGEDASWYKYDKSTIDNASCKMDLYQIAFSNKSEVDPIDMSSCGKTVNSLLEEIVKDTGYLVNMKYALHRKDDTINFRLDNDTKVRFNATEGDNNNILKWESISYTPISALFNTSVQVYKGNDEMYHYVDSKYEESVLKYQEQCTLATDNDVISSKEAYWNAIHAEKYNPVQTYTFSITVPNYPHLRIGDMVKVVADAKKLNTIKEIQSIKVTFDIGHMPRIQTTLGLGELDPDLQVKENIRKLRRQAKKENTYFSSSAVPVKDLTVYEWDN